MAIGLELLSLATEWYEECGLDQECYEFGNGWSFVWAWVGAWWVIMGVNFLVMTFGAWFWWPRYIGCIMNCCLANCTLIGGIVSIVAVGRPYGRICSYNRSTSTYKGDYEWDFDGMTYEDEFGMLLGVGVLSFVFWFFQCCCCWIPCYTTPLKAKDSSNKYELKPQSDR